jgi:hypothetical protein
VGDQNYWVRTEQGRVWGPYTLKALDRLKGQLTERCEASLDGQAWRPGGEFPELKDLLVPAQRIEKRAPPPTSDPPRISRALAEAFGMKEAPAAAAEAPPPPAAKKPEPKKTVAPEPAPVTDKPLELPESGSLDEVSPARLYALAALTNANGWLVLEHEKGKLLTISFRRGTPEHLSTDDPDLSLVRFLQQRGVVPADKAIAAEEQAQKSGQDLVSVMFQMQLIPPADAHRLLGDYASSLLDRALMSWRGKFTFEKDSPSPPGAFPLGAKWTLLSESVRRLDVPRLRARLGKRLPRPVVRSGGMGIGKVDELSLNAQEARLYASLDGTRTGEELLKSQDAGVTVRLLYLLSELGHLSFADTSEAEAEPEVEPVPAKPLPKAEPAQKPAAPSAAAAPKRELPKIAREAGRQGPAPGRGAPPAATKSAPPVMQSSATAASKPAPPMKPPPAWAQGPANEAPTAQLQRLSTLLDRLTKADHFEAIGVGRKGATGAEAKRNFFVLAKELHPDTVTDPAQAELKALKEQLFARINEAAQIVGDDKRRKEYEDELEGKKNSVDVARIFAAEENFQRAEIMIKARKYQEGLELLEKAISMNDQEAEFYAWRGYARFLISQDRKSIYEQTAADCRKAIKMVDRCLPAHLFLGHMSKVVGDMKLAKRCYLKVLELEPKHVEAQRELRLMGSK